MKKLEHLLTFILVRTIYFFFEMMPVRLASDIGGFLGKAVGPLLPVTKVAQKNLMHVMPERRTEHSRIIRDMWENFGRVFAEYPHLKTIAQSKGGTKIDVINMENFHKFRDMGKGGLIISAHLANWEFGTYAGLAEGVPMHVVYRPPNNPLVDRLLASARAGGAKSSIEKGADGAKDIIRYIKSSEYIAMLIDQKMNNGIELNFMGKPAMTAPAAAQLAIKYQIPIILIWPERVKGLHFRWHCSQPFIPAPDTDPAQLMQELNDQLGEWVREHPGQWLWIHRRWKN